jgi:hypothetical protein
VDLAPRIDLLSDKDESVTPTPTDGKPNMIIIANMKKLLDEYVANTDQRIHSEITALQSRWEIAENVITDNYQQIRKLARGLAKNDVLLGLLAKQFLDTAESYNKPLFEHERNYGNQRWTK